MQEQEKNDTRLLNEALAKAQAEIRNASVNKENAFVGSKYADLGSVWDACRKPLTDNGLSVVQLPDTIDGEIVLRTLLLHSAGQSIEGFLPLAVFGIKDAHSLGSAFTYARRYSFAAMVGCAPEGDDDDGNTAQRGKKYTPARSKSLPRKKKDERSTAEKAQGIINAVREADGWLRNMGVDPGDPPAQVCQRIVTLGVDGLEKKIEDERKKAAKAEKAEKEKEAAKIVEDADKVEPVEDEKEEEVAA